MYANHHRNTKYVDLVAAISRNMHGFEHTGGEVLSLGTGWQANNARTPVLPGFTTHGRRARRVLFSAGNLGCRETPGSPGGGQGGLTFNQPSL
jgi:hypothetical protein